MAKPACCDDGAARADTDRRLCGNRLDWTGRYIDRSLVDDMTKQGLFGNSQLHTDEITALVLNHREEMWKTPLS